MKPPQAKKRRSALRKDLFEPLPAGHQNKASRDTNGHASANGHLPEAGSDENGALAEVRELTLRGAKKAGKRSEKGTDETRLASNDFYTVSQLPCLPDQLRARVNTAFSSTVSTELGYILALTHSEALIWPYNTSSSSPSPRDFYQFSLPTLQASAADPLPFGAFVSNSAHEEPGLVVVSPIKGKITYWDTISHASSLLPGQRSHGVEGSIPGMFGGESVVGIVNAEPAGFVLILSHGRIAHLTVKDQLGRPSIGIQFLRKIPPGGNTGFLGSIRNAFGGSGRKTRPSVIAGRGSKSQRDVIIVTEDGELEFWDLRANTSDTLQFQVALRNDLLEALSFSQLPGEHSTYQMRVLDISVGRHKEHALQRPGDKPTIPLITLVSLSNENHASYFLLEVNVSEDTTAVEVTHPIRCYQQPISISSTWVTRLCIPKPHEIAFIIFEKAVVLFSLARHAESPSSQLRMEGSSLPEPFQDAIRFQDASTFRIIGCGMENKSQSHHHPSCVLSIAGFGLARISATVQTHDEESDEADEAKITTKSRIEQAVFFGAIKNNPLDLVHGSQDEASQEEIEHAAEAISKEILSSSSAFLPPLSSSLEEHLKLRARTLENLARHLVRHYPLFSRAARFQLSAAAEKVAAERAMWKVEEDARQRLPKDRLTLLELILNYMSKNNKTGIDKEKGETDPIRHWFTKDTDRLDVVIVFLPQIFRELEKDDVKNPELIAEYLYQAESLFIAAHDAAFRYRESTAATFGLGDEQFKEGVLVNGYHDLRSPWTSSPRDLDHKRRLLRIVSEFLEVWWEQSHLPKTGSPSRETLSKISHNFSPFLDLLLRVEDERIRFCSDQDDTMLANDAIRVKKYQRHDRRKSLYFLSNIGMSPEARNLAEKWRDMEALNELHKSYEEAIELRETEGTSTDKVSIDRKEVTERDEGYFDKYGDQWACARFGRMVQTGQLGSLLKKGDDPKQAPYLERFLRSRSGFAKISWINDILGPQKDYVRAATTLDQTESREQDLWSKKVELCIGRLASLAADEQQIQSTTKAAESVPVTPTQRACTTKFTASLALLNLQERLREHIRLVIGDPTFSLKDPEMKTENAITALVPQAFMKHRAASAQLLGKAIRRVLEGRALDVEGLIDFLTLMKPDAGGIFVDDDQDGAFPAALEAVRILSEATEQALEPSSAVGGVVTAEKRRALEATIWRRCLLADDWARLNKTEGRSDRDVRLAFRNSKAYRTMEMVLAARRERDADKHRQQQQQSRLPHDGGDAGGAPRAVARPAGD